MLINKCLSVLLATMVCDLATFSSLMMTAVRDEALHHC